MNGAKGSGAKTLRAGKKKGLAARGCLGDRAARSMRPPLRQAHRGGVLLYNDSTRHEGRNDVAPETAVARRRDLTPREALVLLGSVDACETPAQLRRLGRAIAATYRAEVEGISLRLLRNRIERKALALESQAWRARD